MAPEAWLLNAGVVAVGHMCRTSTMPDGSLRHEWRREYEAARRANRRLPAHGAAAAAWERQLQRLVAAGVEPEQQECTVELQPTPIAAAMATHARRAAKTVQVDRAAAEEVLADLERSEVREARVKEDWMNLMMSAGPHQGIQLFPHGYLPLSCVWGLQSLMVGLRLCLRII